VAASTTTSNSSTGKLFMARQPQQVQPHVLQHSTSAASCISGPPTTTSSSHKLKQQFLQDHLHHYQQQGQQQQQQINSEEGQDHPDHQGHGAEQQEEEDEDEDEEDEDEDEEDQQPEYVAAVCQYTTILKDAPPGFDNDDYEVNYLNLNDQDADDNMDSNNAVPANDTSPAQNWSAPLNHRTTNFVFGPQESGLRLKASAKVLDEPIFKTGQQKARQQTDTDSSSRRQAVRSTSSERLLDSSDYIQLEGAARSYTHSQDDSSDVPQAVFVRPPARMRIFQTEVDDDDDDDGEEEEEEGQEEEDDDEPPVPPPRSKSKESSLSSGPMHIPPTAAVIKSKKQSVVEGPALCMAGAGETSKSPNDRSVYFDAIEGGGGAVNNDGSVASSGHGPQRRTTPAGQDRSLGSFREGQNVETNLETKKDLNKYSDQQLVSSGGDSCNSKSCSDHSKNQPVSSSSGRRQNKQHRRSKGHHEHGQHHQHQQSSSSRVGDAARRISLDDLSSAFQALISNSSAAVQAAASGSKRSSSKHSSSRHSNKAMNRSFIDPAHQASSDCCQSDNSGLCDHSRSAADRMRSRSEENLLDSRSQGSMGQGHACMDDRGVTCSPVSLKQQSTSLRSNDSSLGGGRISLSSRYVSLF
jgi:hypothetical protein